MLTPWELIPLDAQPIWMLNLEDQTLESQLPDASISNFGPWKPENRRLDP